MNYLGRPSLRRQNTNFPVACIINIRSAASKQILLTNIRSEQIDSGATEHKHADCQDLQLHELDSRIQFSLHSPANKHQSVSVRKRVTLQIHTTYLYEYLSTLLNCCSKIIHSARFVPDWASLVGNTTELSRPLDQNYYNPSGRSHTLYNKICNDPDP